jgi:hypothetical protein
VEVRPSPRSGAWDSPQAGGEVPSLPSLPDLGSMITGGVREPVVVDDSGVTGS